MTKPLTSWSYSRWDLHNTCPLRFKLEVLDGRKEPQNAAMANGQKVHKIAADFLMAPDWNGDPPPELGHAGKLAAEMRQFDNKIVEQQWGYTTQWRPTGWFGDDTWFRSVIDAGVLYEDMSAEVVDWKTGKPRGTHDDQMEIFAVSMMARFQVVTHVTTRLSYTDVKKEEFAEFPRADLDKLIQKWNDKVRPMFAATEYLPRPNDGCKFCPFSRSRTNGVDCRYG